MIPNRSARSSRRPRSQGNRVLPLSSHEEGEEVIAIEARSLPRVSDAQLSGWVLLDDVEGEMSEDGHVLRGVS